MAEFESVDEEKREERRARKEFYVHDAKPTIGVIDNGKNQNAGGWGGRSVVADNRSK